MKAKRNILSRVLQGGVDVHPEGVPLQGAFLKGNMSDFRVGARKPAPETSKIAF